MANIKVEIGYPIKTGSCFTFRAPCDCSVADGLTVVHPGGTDKFTFKDAHGNTLTSTPNLFAKGTVLKAILDVDTGAAFLQNADTNAYLESQLRGTLPATPRNLGVFANERTLEDALLVELEEMDELQTKRFSFTIKNIYGVDTQSHTWICSFCAWSYDYATLTAESSYGGGVTRITKALIGGEWQPFEWENPPMKEGVEYRTTERDAGDPVYVKMVGVSVPVINDTYGVPDVIAIGEREYVFVTDITGVVYKTDDGTANTSASVSWDLSHVSVQLYKDTYDGQSPSDQARSFNMTITNNSVDEAPAYARITIKYVRKEG